MSNTPGAKAGKMQTQSKRRMCVGCGRQVKGKIRRQRCENCYRSYLRRSGRTPIKVIRLDNSVEAMVGRAKRTSSGCWLYTGRLDRDGYGLMVTTSPGVRARPHRAVYEHFVGPIPEGMQVDHLCHEAETCRGGSTCLHRRCINPAHLRPATARTNSLRSNSITAQNAVKTHCVNGHEFSPENTEIRTRRDGRTWRHCLACYRVRNPSTSR